MYCLPLCVNSDVRRERRSDRSDDDGRLKFALLFFAASVGRQTQVAANTRGVALLQGLVSEYGLDVISAYMGHIQVAHTTAVTGSLFLDPFLCVYMDVCVCMCVCVLQFASFLWTLAVTHGVEI